MGYINRYTCIRCGKQSKEYYVGGGMFDTLALNVCSCVRCAHTVERTIEVECRFFPDYVRKESRTYNIESINEVEYDMVLMPNSLELVSIPHIQHILHHNIDELDSEQRYLKKALDNGEVHSIDLSGRIIDGRCPETGEEFIYEIYHETLHLKCSKCGGKMINGVLCPDCKIPMNMEEVGSWD